jgi:hypothetical protein
MIAQRPRVASVATLSDLVFPVERFGTALAYSPATTILESKLPREESKPCDR